MILGFFGKGGSGKSSAATQMALYAAQQRSMCVLAIDADHNMDLSFNLTNGSIPKDVVQLSRGAQSIKAYVGIDTQQPFADAFAQTSDARFRLQPLDSFSAAHTVKITDSIRLMVAGFQNEKVLHEKACAHSLSAPLKIYLPFLELQENEVVVVDEKAGADGVTTGVVSGIDVAVIMCDPSLHSIKTAKQIAELMDFYKTPYMFVGNKVLGSDDRVFVETTLGEVPVVYISHHADVQQMPGIFCDMLQPALETIHEMASNMTTNSRLQRTIEKYARNRGVICS